MAELWKVSLENETVKMQAPGDIKCPSCEQVIQAGEEVIIERNARRVFREVVLSPQNQFNGDQLLTANDVADKIRDEEKDFILLDDTEMNVLRGAFKAVKGMGEMYLFAAKAVLRDAKQVPVEANESAKKDNVLIDMAKHKKKAD